MKLKVWLPLIGFLVLAGFLGVGLTLNPREIPSALIDKPMPELRLVRLDNQDQVFEPGQMRGQVWLLNVWASWCVGCRQEHGALMDIAQSNAVPIVGLNYKEVRGDARSGARGLSLSDETALAVRKANTWLDEQGDPYEFTVLDVDGRAGIDLGVYGVPETFLIDRQGHIRHKHLGPLSAQAFKADFLPRIHELQRAE